MPTEVKWPFHLVVNATRYCIGRMSYAVSEHVDWLVEHWGELDSNTRLRIGLDLEKEFARDDMDRNRGHDVSRPLSLGMDMDRREWERVRALYQNT